MIHVLSCVMPMMMLFTQQADDPATLRIKAFSAYEAGSYADAARLYVAAIEAGLESAAPAYNAACCYALLGKSDEAFAWIDRSIEAGWTDVEQLKIDTDSKSLHEDPRWPASIRKCEDANVVFRKSLTEPELRDELLKRVVEDQRVRTTPQPDMEEWQKVDADNLTYMKTVIDKYGWPGKSMVGSDGAEAAFLMVQHSDNDPTFQKMCLELLIEAVEQDEACASDMALLTDRVVVAEV